MKNIPKNSSGLKNIGVNALGGVGFILTDASDKVLLGGNEEEFLIYRKGELASPGKNASSLKNISKNG